MVHLNIEIEGMNGAFYEAQIKSISGKLLTVIYENNPQEEVEVYCDWARLRPTNYSCNADVGDEVEVFTRLNDREPFGWWRAELKATRAERYLVQYEDGFREVVKSGSIRSKNTNTFFTAEMLVQIFQREEATVRLQEKQCHAPAETKDQGCQTQADDSHPMECAGSSEQRAHATLNSSSRHHKGPSSEANSGQPPDHGEPTELWETDEDQPAWTLKLPTPPPKVKKSKNRRRNCQRELREYTLDDEYDDEEIRMTPQGACLFRLFGSRWVAME